MTTREVRPTLRRCYTDSPLTHGMAGEVYRDVAPMFREREGTLHSCLQTLRYVIPIFHENVFDVFSAYRPTLRLRYTNNPLTPRMVGELCKDMGGYTDVLQTLRYNIPTLCNQSATNVFLTLYRRCTIIQLSYVWHCFNVIPTLQPNSSRKKLTVDNNATQL